MTQRLAKIIVGLIGLLLGGGLLWLWLKRNSARPVADSAAHPLVTRLGAGRATRLGVGNKGALLDRAAQAGLAVPSGVILRDEAWQQATQAGLVVGDDEQITVPDAARLLDFLQLPACDRPLAVRSAFSAEDGQAESLAGFFTSKLFVDPHDPVALTEAIAEVWTSAHKRPGHFRRDVLLMEMIEAKQAGVAFSEREFEDDLINHTGGTADKLVSGEVEGQSLGLPKLRNWEWYAIPPEEKKEKKNKKEKEKEKEKEEAGHSSAARWPMRLQKLLRNVRREFGDNDWDIEWADDGRRCWLVQIRPITRPSRRNEAFTSANFKELFPELPSRYMASLIATCAEGLFAYYRRFDPSLPRHRPISETFYGRPFFNLSLLTEMMRRWGLPTQLVTGNIGGETDQAHGFNPYRFLSKTFVLLRVGWAQLRAVASAEETIQIIADSTKKTRPTFTTCIALHRWLFTTLVTEMFSLTSAMSGPLQLLRRAGVLAEQNARQQTITTEMFTDLEPLRGLAAQSEPVRTGLAEGRLPDNPDFRRMWRAYLDKHGHRGIYESDIARPRLHEAPEALLRSLAQPTHHRSTPPPRTLLGRLTLPLWWQASRTMQAREALRYQAIIGFDRLRQTLLTLADQAVAQGQLPEREALWQLSIDEIRRLDQGWQPEADFFTQRRAEIERLKAYDLPDFFRRFDDLEQFDTSKRHPTGRENGRHLKGISLTEGQVQGKAWVLTEPSADLPPGFEAERTILIARSIDAGWIPTFSRVAGAVIEIGGDLSHGSILLREIGLPAITNAKGATRFLQTGDPVHLRAGAGVLEKI